jgi:hypothetical protein
MVGLRVLVRGAFVAAIALAAGAFAGCSTPGGCCDSTLPPDLPADPEPCARYCRVWVPPVYRKVPKLCQVSPECYRCEPETVQRIRFREVCVKPCEQVACRTPDRRCEEAAVQVTPGGWRWKQDECGCWKYCYEPPCYQWCNKVVTEEGIDYCVERPPEYRTEAWWEDETCTRMRRIPPRYKIVYEEECYRPGYWQWVVQDSCTDCVCPAPCPTRPIRRQPCAPGTDVLTPDCPRCN